MKEDIEMMPKHSPALPGGDDVLDKPLLAAVAPVSPREGLRRKALLEKSLKTTPDDQHDVPFSMTFSTMPSYEAPRPTTRMKAHSTVNGAKKKSDTDFDFL